MTIWGCPPCWRRRAGRGERCAISPLILQASCSASGATSSPSTCPAALRREAVEAADKALDAVRHYRFQAADDKVVSNLAASAGVALYPFHGADALALLSNVDIAMYQAKD